MGNQRLKPMGSPHGRTIQEVNAYFLRCRGRSVDLRRYEAT